MPVSIARTSHLSWNPLRTSYCCSLAALLIFLGCESLQNATAEGDTRTISLHHMHTGEDLTITYKVDGKYDEEALKKINYELRDWRKNEVITMDPHLIDLVWEVQRDVGAKGPIQVVCGYRSPDTNAMLRRRSSGVAKNSQHMLGKAMDFYIPGVPLETLRAVGLFLEKGGVGYYPTSGSPFVHMDTGHVRHWPAVASNQMPVLMAKGRELAMAAANMPASSGRPVAVAAADPAKPAPVAQPRPAKQPALVAKRQQSFELASAESRPINLAPSRPAQAASLVNPSLVNRGSDVEAANQVISDRGFWDSATGQPNDPPRPPAPVNNVSAGVTIPAANAEMDATGTLAPWPIPEHTGSNEAQLAYAAPIAPAAPLRPAPMGQGALAPAARVVTPLADTTVAVKRSGDQPTTIVSPPAATPVRTAAKTGEKYNDPWTRAMIVSPSAQHYMSTSLFGVADFRSLAVFMQKPSATVMMTFSEDPYLGMNFSKFGGTAVVFVPTVTFAMRTAALR